jgi:hypothetical protein
METKWITIIQTNNQLKINEDEKENQREKIYDPYILC